MAGMSQDIAICMLLCTTPNFFDSVVCFLAHSIDCDLQGRRIRLQLSRLRLCDSPKLTIMHMSTASLLSSAAGRAAVSSATAGVSRWSEGSKAPERCRMIGLRRHWSCQMQESFERRHRCGLRWRLRCCPGQAWQGVTRVREVQMATGCAFAAVGWGSWLRQCYWNFIV